MATKLFELTPINEKPEVFGSYYCIDENDEIYQWFFDMEGWSIKDNEPKPKSWFKPISNIVSGGHSFIQYHPDIILPDGIYNGRYNKEPAIIRIKGGEPDYVSFIGFLSVEGESRSSAIYDKRGILASSVEVLLKSQVLSEGCYF